MVIGPLVEAVKTASEGQSTTTPVHVVERDLGAKALVAVRGWGGTAMRTGTESGTAPEPVLGGWTVVEFAGRLVGGKGVRITELAKPLIYRCRTEAGLSVPNTIPHVRRPSPHERPWKQLT